MSKIEMVGKTFTKLTVIKECKERKNGEIYYQCRCDCGNIVVTKGASLRSGKTKSCGCLKKNNQMSKKIRSILNTIKNNCKIINGYYLETARGKKRLFAVCECLTCHNQFEIRYDTLNHLHGHDCPQCNIKAKGQLQRKPHREHRLWRIWWAMKDRCYNKNNNHYKDYGERGIIICDEWLADFETFYNWAIDNGYGKGLTIDRIDNNKGYSPSNCQWVDQSVQARNNRRNFLLWYNAKWLWVEDIAKIENISYDTAYYRYVTRKNTRLPRKQLYNIDNIKK